MFKVLHVEGNAFYIELVRDLISDLDLGYLSAHGPEEAFQILKDTEIGMVITGLEFNTGAGEDFIVQLNNSRFDNIPVIVLSAIEDKERRRKVMELGVLDIISKNSLAEKLKGYIRSYQAADFTHEKLRTISIAVLDDNEFELRRIRRIFELYRICNADYYSDPQQMLDSGKSYDLYLVDYILPGITGEQVIARMRSMLEYALVIAISSIDDNAVISSILNSGADDFIAKPYDEGVFMARLRTNVRTYLLLEQLKQKNQELERRVRIDSLTELFNHKAVIQALEYEIEQCTRNFRHLSVLMLDIDNFKQLNDKYGHQKGDEILVKVSEIFQSTIRKGDIIGRYGGEEFMVILPETQLQGAYLVAEKLRKGVEAADFGVQELSVRVSGGVAQMNGDTPVSLIRKADDMLYKAKTCGKNRICKE